MRIMKIMHYPLGALLVAALAVTGCSSDSESDGGDSGSSGGAGVDVDGAKEDLASIVSTDDALDLPPLEASVPSGKTVSYINCPLPICVQVGEGVQEAAGVLGWDVREVAMDLTPAGYLEAWEQIAQNPGDGVVSAAQIVPDSDIKEYTDQAAVPVVPITDVDPPSGDIVAVIESPRNVQRQGEAEGNWVIQDAGKAVKTVFVYDPSITAIASAYPGFESALKKNCSDCSVDVLKVSVAQVGPALAQQVVSYLQANPDVKYVAFGLGDLATGVPEAISAAGLEDQAKLVVRAATPTNLEQVKSGGLAAAFTDEIYEAGWRAVDVILRAQTDQEFEPLPSGKIFLVTNDSLPEDITVPFTVPGYQDQFKQAWGVS